MSSPTSCRKVGSPKLRLAPSIRARAARGRGIGVFTGHDRNPRPTDDDEVLFSLSFVLQHVGKKKFRHADEIAAQQRGAAPPGAT